MADRAESIATFPPPMTATFFPTFMGVSNSGNWYDFIKFGLESELVG